MGCPDRSQPRAKKLQTPFGAQDCSRASGARRPHGSYPEGVGNSGGNRKKHFMGKCRTASGDNSSCAAVAAVRAPVLALGRAREPSEVANAADSLKVALLAAADSDTLVEGALLGMAAAHAGRLNLRDSLETLCAYSWSRLVHYGGREVAELTTAAVKHGCADTRFLHAVVEFCATGGTRSRFGCLRDIAMMATALLRRVTLPSFSDTAQSIDQAIAFHGLAQAALPHLSAGSKPLRDCVEFLYSFAHTLTLRPLAGGPQLCEVPVAEEVLLALFSSVTLQLHQSSPQDIAKIADAVATISPLLPQIAEDAVQPCIVDLVQAVRFRHNDFNSQDLALTAVAFAKLDNVDSRILTLLHDKIAMRSSDLSSKNLSLLLRAFAKPSEAGSRLLTSLVAEMHKRQLKTLSAQDLCMAMQALARLGETGKPLICLLAFEAYQRQLAQFTAANKAMFLWSLAKAKVFHTALCHLIVRSLSSQNLATLTRDIVSAALWAVAVVWPSITSEDYWPRKLVEALCASCPWQHAPPYEVANAAWAFGQLHESITATSWVSLVTAIDDLTITNLSLHEMCNVLSGFSVVPHNIEGGLPLLGRFVSEVNKRNAAGEDFSARDRRELTSALSRVSDRYGNCPNYTCGPELAELQAHMKASDPVTNRQCQSALSDEVSVSCGKCSDPELAELQVHMTARDPVTRRRSWSCSSSGDSVPCRKCSDIEPRCEPDLCSLKHVIDKCESQYPGDDKPRQHTSCTVDKCESQGPGGDKHHQHTLCTVDKCESQGPGGDRHHQHTSCAVDKCESQGCAGDKHHQHTSCTVDKCESHGPGGDKHHQHISCSFDKCDFQGAGGDEQRHHNSSCTGDKCESQGAGGDKHHQHTSCTIPKCESLGSGGDKPHQNKAHHEIHHGTNNKKTENVSASSHWQHDKVQVCEQQCCPTVLSPGINKDLRINAHCNYHGHCVRLKNTFIHVECAGGSDDEFDNCMLCKLSKSRSSGNLTVPSDWLN